MSDYRPFLPEDLPEARRSEARAFASVVRMLAIAGPDGNPAEVARAARASDRVQKAVKAAVPAGTLTGDDSLAAYASVSGAWLASLRLTGVFDRMYQDMRQAPVLQRFSTVTQTFVADEVNEGMAKPIASFSVAGNEPLRPRKAAAIMVISNELARTSDANRLIEEELRAAIVAGVDAVFLADLIAAVTPGGSTNSVADVDALLQAVPLGTASVPFFVLAADVARLMSTERTGNIRLWPELGILSGSINGVPALVTDRLPAGASLLVDAAAIAANLGSIEVQTSRMADLVMDTAPTMSVAAGSPAAPVPAQVVSLFQSNSTAIRAERTFAFRVLRSNAVAAITGGGSP